MKLKRKFEGAIRVQGWEVPVLFSTIGDKENPDLIVTATNSKLGMILKPAFNGNRWWLIHHINLDLTKRQERDLEVQLNGQILLRGQTVIYQCDPLRIEEEIAA